MVNSSNKTMTTPTPNDWTGLGIIWGIVSAIVTIAFKWINEHYKDRKLEKETFINSVVQTAMNGCLNDVNSKINTLFEYREKDRENLDRKFDAVLKEVRK